MADGDKNPNSNPNLDLDPVLKLSPTAKSGSNDDKLRNLLELGFVKTVALKLDEVIQNCKLALTDLDDRALDALKEYPPDAALAVLDKFSNTNLEHVSNKSAFLCGLLKTVRQKSWYGFFFRFFSPFLILSLKIRTSPKTLGPIILNEARDILTCSLSLFNPI